MQFLKRHRWQVWLLAIIILFAFALGLLTFAPDPSKEIGQAQDEGETTPLVILNEDNIKQATVFIMQAFDGGNGPVISCVGSGTLVTSDGLILTNFHVVEPSDVCPADRLIISLTIDVNEPPVPTYLAEVVEQNRGLDLAVLRISSYLDGRVIEPGILELPFVELGDSSTSTLDETIYVFGYPEIRNDPVQVVRGTISGFTAEARLGERAWLRTTADIPGVMTGGGAYNRDGRLIAIPTITPARIAGSVLDCRQIYDTNADNQIDSSDNCIPIGGSISAMRPSRLARGLVRAAVLGIQPGPERSPLVQPPPTDPPDFSRLFVSTGVNNAGMPINVVEQVPTGTQSLYLFFDYDNMQDGFVYELRTTIDGRPNLTYSLPPVTWSGGRSGLWYIGGSVSPAWPNGQYEFTLFVEGRQVASHRIQVGGGPSTNPQFFGIVFATQNAEGELVGANYVLPESNIIRAQFNYLNMQPGLGWQQRWYLGDSDIPINADATTILTWDEESTQGVNTDDAGIEEPNGFPSGQYRLELWIQLEEGADPILSATADFVVAGGAGGLNNAQAQIFNDFRFAQGENANTPVSVTNESFSDRIPSLYVFFNWRQLATGTPFVWRWLVDDDVLIETYDRWSVEPNGENYFFSLVGAPLLPDATYTFEIEIAGIRLTEELSVSVGLGQLPLDIFQSAEGVQMRGKILDAESGQGIPGAVFIVLFADLEVEDFIWEDEQILSMARTDRNGFFQLPNLLPRGTLEEPALYSVLIRADDYLPVSADGIIVTDETQSPLELTVELSRD
jgi:hypothetical protein